MNGLIIAAGAFALFTTVGHFAVGTKLYLKPMLDASFDELSRKVMHCVFHYVSTFLILSTAALLLVGFGKIADGGVVTEFIAVNYAAFAVWQIILAATSGISGGIIKMFQWIFFVAIAVLAWIGA